MCLNAESPASAAGQMVFATAGEVIVAASAPLVRRQVAGETKAPVPWVVASTGCRSAHYQRSTSAG